MPLAYTMVVSLQLLFKTSYFHLMPLFSTFLISISHDSHVIWHSSAQTLRCCSNNSCSICFLRWTLSRTCFANCFSWCLTYNVWKLVNWNCYRYHLSINTHKPKLQRYMYCTVQLTSNSLFIRFSLSRFSMKAAYHNSSVILIIISIGTTYFLVWAWSNTPANWRRHSLDGVVTSDLAPFF